MLSRFLDKKKQKEGGAGAQPPAQGSLLDLMAPLEPTSNASVHGAEAQTIASPNNSNSLLQSSPPQAPHASLSPLGTGQGGAGSLLSEFNSVEAEERLRLHKAHADLLEQQRIELETRFAATASPEPAPSKPGMQNLRQAEQLELLSEELDGLKRRARGRSMSEDGRAASNFGGNAPPPQPALMEFLSFDNFVVALMKGWKTILVCAIAGAVLAALYAVTLPNKYESVAEILLEPRGLKLLNNSVSPNGLNGDATVAYAESQVRIIYSSSVIDQVVDDLELAEDHEFSGGSTGGLLASLNRLMKSGPVTSNNRVSAKQYLLENLDVQRVGQTYTILLGVTTGNPEKSARIANALASAYIADESGARSNVARSASEDLTSRLDELRQQVRINEEKVEKYRAANGLVDANGRLASEVQLERLNEQLVLARVQVSDAKTRANQAAKANLADVISGSLPSNLSNATVNQLRIDYSRANARLERLKTKLGSRHPERIAAESERRSALNAISSEMKRVVQTAQENYKRAVARQQDLTAQVNQLKGAAVNDSAAMVKLRELSREVEASRQIYESVLLRSRETGTEQNLRSSSVRIISEATPNYDKSGPNRKLIVLAGGIVGAGFGVVFALVTFVLLGLRQIGIGRNKQPKPSEPMPGDLYSTSPDPAYAHWRDASRSRQHQTTPPPMYETWDAQKEYRA